MIKIPKQATIIGSLMCDKDVEVSARVKGNSNIKGILIINKDCEWTGNPVADHIIVEGRVKGDIIARKKIEIKPSATIIGSVTSPQVIIPKSAILDCYFKMDTVKEAAPFTPLKKKKERELKIPDLQQSAKDVALTA
ncbi:MAG: polymer-forming cytoskeletal protein [Gammaproteobacteria bacterium]|nr:polymer-forming cytoskeletal protein [Gammaproteobacteria bacterium]